MAGRWQMPLLPVAAAALWLSLPPLPPPPSTPEETFEALRAEMDRAFDAREFTTAAALGARLIAWESATPPQRAELHLCVARSLLELAPESTPSAELTGRIEHHFTEAQKLGASPTAEDHATWAATLERSGQYYEALAQTERAIDLGGDADALMRRVIELRHDNLRQPPESVEPIYREYTECVQDDPAMLAWALPRLVDVLLEENKLDEALAALSRWSGDVGDASTSARLELQRAEALERSGRLEEAELVLRSARNCGIDDADADAGAACLLGRILAGSGAEGAPLEAMAYFDESLRLSPSGPWSVAAHVGIAEILAELRRDVEAAGEFSDALATLTWAVNPAEAADRLRVSMMQCAQTARSQGRLEAAFRYLDLMGPLVADCSVEIAAAHWDIHAQTCAALAVRLRDANEPKSRAATRRPNVSDEEEREAEEEEDPARLMFRKAAESYDATSRLEGLEPERVAEALFNAADMYSEARDADAAVLLFDQVATRYPSSPRAPRALLRRGQWLQACGMYAQAIDAYRRCSDDYPGTLYALQALVPLAETYVAMGDSDEHLAQAESLLRHLLNDVDVVHPDSREFEDALFLLGRVVERRGQFERAIAIYTEALDRYPDDARRDATLFALADSYRQSGLTLKEAARKAMSGGASGSAGGGAPLDYGQRLSEARRLFDRVVAAYESRNPSTLSPLESMYYRYALLYEADCLFETLQYADAIKLYQVATGALSSHVDALAAHVQIINCHVFLGQPQEARAALDVARRAMDRLPDEAFKASITGQTREDWKKYFDWLDQSKLF